MVPKVQATIDARDEKIAADLKAAEAAREAADGLEETYRVGIEKGRTEASTLTAAAKADAARATEKSIATADKSIAAKTEKAAAKVAEARAAARSEIEAVAGAAAQAMVERVTGIKVEEKAAREAATKELAHG